MHILITGAGGFVGRNLVQRLMATTTALAWTRLTLVDLQLPNFEADPRIVCLAGSLADPDLLARAVAIPVDVAFHLASVPGGAAERNYELGYQVNLHATLRLFDLLQNGSKAPRVVFASTIAVYGSPLPAVVDEGTPLRPGLTYGAHKLMAEVQLEDLSRRGRLDGISLRLPGIVARPPQTSGLLSAFMSDVFWKLRDGEEFVCPVSEQGTAWWMSVGCCVDNLLHAACLPAGVLDAKRSLALPVLHLRMSQVVEGLMRYLGPGHSGRVTYVPDPTLDRTFAMYPPMVTPTAHELGFRHDGSIDNLVKRTLEG